ncbi:MAG TPA: VCBS repeat-containing protein [Kofleriaceae bacterium]|nr:VCBS repeat-containing protein [Kofleriaceae bacterium]
MKRAIACTLPLSLSACNLYFHSADNKDAAPLDAPADATVDAPAPQDPSQRCRAALFVATADQVQTWRSEVDPTRAPFNRITRFATGAGESDQQRTLWGDVNGDGLTDLVVASSTASPARSQTFLQRSDGSFAASITTNLISDVAPLRLGVAATYVSLVADANGDGKADLLVIDSTAATRVRFYRGTATGAFDPVPVVSIDTGINAAGQTATSKTLTGDVDGDGDLDLVHVNASTQRVQSYFNNGVGVFTNGALTENFLLGNVVDSARHIHLADVTRDRRADLIFGHQDSNTGIDTYVASAMMPGRFAITSMHSGVVGFDAGRAGDETSEVADWNGDGLVDWIFAYQSERSIVLGQGDGTFAPTTRMIRLITDTSEQSAPVVGFSAVRSSGIGVASADRDHDGLADCLDSDADGDGILNTDEDLNNNRDLGDDDADGDGAPNYLDAITRAPGGVAGNLAFWTMASESVSVDNGVVVRWDSVAGEPTISSGRGAGQTLRLAQLNGFPTIAFDGNQNNQPHGWLGHRWLEASSPLAGRGQWTQFAVTRNNALDGNYLFTTRTGCGLDPFIGHWVHNDGKGGIWSRNGTSYEVTASANTQFSATAATLAVSARTSATTFALYDQGGLVAVTGERDITLGDDVAFHQMTRCGAQAHAGELAEQLLFRSALTDAQRGHVASYLAIKYGLQLPLGQSYVSSDPAIMPWNATDRDGLAFDHRVTVVGRDDISGLRLLNSRSQQAGAVITLAVPDPAQLNTNRSFVAIGDDDGSVSFSTGDAPEGLKRQARVFRVVVTGLAQTMVRLAIPRSVLPPSPTPQTLSVLLSATTAFADATTYSMTLQADEYSVDVPIQNSAFFAIAMPLTQ